MADAELQTFKDQLAFVNLSLEADPENADLLSLKQELLEIIELTAPSSSAAPVSKGKGKETASASVASNTNWQDQGQYKAGADCMAKYKDGKWSVLFVRTVRYAEARLTNRYPAKINAVIGSADSPLYTITFKGYTSSTNVPLSSLKPHDPNAPIPTPQPSNKRAHESLSEKEKDKKKKKGEKWMATQTARTEDMRDKKTAWDKFGKKAQKKGIHISGYVRL